MTYDAKDVLDYILSTRFKCLNCCNNWLVGTFTQAEYVFWQFIHFATFVIWKIMSDNFWDSISYVMLIKNIGSKWFYT